MSTEDKSREEFEAWYREGVSAATADEMLKRAERQPDIYADIITDSLWDGWQACWASRRTYRASVLEEAAEICDAHAERRGRTDKHEAAAIDDCAEAIRELAARGQ